MSIKIPKEREEEIYYVSLKEFSKHGYKNASTNNITNNLDISKGTLFNYFKNKRNLYMFVLEKSLSLMEKEIIYTNVKLSEDIFDRIMDVTKIKMKVFKEYPMECKLVTDFLTKEDEEFHNEITFYCQKYYKISEEYLMNNIDSSKFKDDLDIKIIFGLILSISEYISNNLLKKYENFIEDMVHKEDTITKEIETYMNIIKHGVYK